jgi:hypothetical protein
MSIRPWHSIARKRQREKEDELFWLSRIKLYRTRASSKQNKRKRKKKFPSISHWLVVHFRLDSNDSSKDDWTRVWRYQRNAIIVKFPFWVFSVPAAALQLVHRLFFFNSRAGQVACVWTTWGIYRVCNQQISRIDMRHEDAII